MKITFAFSCLIFICVVHQAVSWWVGGSGRSSRGRIGGGLGRVSSRSRSGFSRSGLGLWERGSSRRFGSSRGRSSFGSSRSRSGRPITRTSTSRDRKSPEPAQISKTSEPKTFPKPIQKPNQKPVDMKAVIEKYEGSPMLKAYDAQPKNNKYHDTTIGIGFNLKRDDAKKTFEKVLPGVDFNKVKQGKQSITETQARKLFNNDVDNIYVPRAKNKIGAKTFENLPSNAKTAVVNAVYRGDLGPKTAKLMREGKWDKVKAEYLDHQQYKNADKLGIPGIKSRMDWNAQQFESIVKPKD